MAQGLKSDSMTIQQAEKLAQDYCTAYGVEYSDLSQFKTSKKVRKIRGVRVDFMRMALSYYLRSMGFPWRKSGILAGYAGHSTIKLNWGYIGEMIQNKDGCFYPYWLGLMAIVDRGNTYQHLKEVA